MLCRYHKSPSRSLVLEALRPLLPFLRIMSTSISLLTTTSEYYALSTTRGTIRASLIFMLLSLVTPAMICIAMLPEMFCSVERKAQGLIPLGKRLVLYRH